MARSVPRLAPLCLLIAVIGLCWPKEAESKLEDEMSIQQITSKDVCTGVTAPNSCPIHCFRADPVCGVDGRTYWCGCGDALCSGTPVAKIGACEIGNGGTSSLPRQALLLVHLLWLIVLGFSLLLGLF